MLFLSQISVVLPIHNGQPYVKRCFKSLLIQTLQDFEIIVVNDGSDDGSVEELNRLMGK